jgi:hypothetical protein
MAMGLGQAAGHVTLAWQASSSTNKTGYYVYYGLKSGSYNYEISVGKQTSVTISNLIEGATYYFTATTHDGGESPFSNVASFTVPVNPTNHQAMVTLPSPVAGQYKFVVSGANDLEYVVERSTDLIHWTPIMTNTAPLFFTATNGVSKQTYYRTVAYQPVGTNESTARLIAPTRTPETFSFEVTGGAGQTYIVQTSSNLVNWTAIDTNVAPFDFVATNFDEPSQRFYRAVQPQ